VHPENQRQADFFCGKPNGITFPYCSGGIHFLAFFVKLLGTKNSMIFAIDHPTCKNKTEAKKFLILTNLYGCLRAVSPEDIWILARQDVFASQTGRERGRRAQERSPRPPD